MIWESNTLYRVNAVIQSSESSTELDPIDALFVNYDTMTSEQGGIHWTTRGNPGVPDLIPNNLFRSASPRKPETVGGPQTYMSLFYSNNSTMSTVPDSNRLRPLVSIYNTEDLFQLGTGSDPLEIMSLQVERLTVLGQPQP